MASNIPIVTTLPQVVRSTSFVPIQLITNTNSSQLSSLIPSMDLTEMSDYRKGFITCQVFLFELNFHG